MKARDIVLAVLVVAATTGRGNSSPVQWPVADGGNGHYYERVDMQEGAAITWQDAKNAAEARSYLGASGHLATITSGSENQFIVATFLLSTPPGQFYGQYWLGGFQDPYPGGSWQWITGEVWTYSNWWVTEPSGDGCCLEIASSSIGPPNLPGTWNDEASTRTLGGYIVEYVVMEVGIDVKPGSYPNAININGHGVIPVAILGSAEFDVTHVDTGSLSFAGLAMRVKGNSLPQCSVEDVSGPDGVPDGIDDLVCQFVDDPDSWTPGDGVATLTGALLPEYGGTHFAGSDQIVIVP